MLAKEQHRKKELEEASNALVAARENALILQRVKAQKALLPDSVLQVKEIMLIYAVSKLVLYCTNEIVDKPWDFTIQDTIAALPKQDFYLVNKGVIIARSNIVAVYQFTDTTYQVELHYPAVRMVTVSQRKRKAFDLWYGHQILPKREKSGTAG